MRDFKGKGAHYWTIWCRDAQAPGVTALQVSLQPDFE